MAASHEHPEVGHPHLPPDVQLTHREVVALRDRSAPRGACRSNRGSLRGRARDPPGASAPIQRPSSATASSRSNHTSKSSGTARRTTTSLGTRPGFRSASRLTSGLGADHRRRPPWPRAGADLRRRPTGSRRVDGPRVARPIDVAGALGSARREVAGSVRRPSRRTGQPARRPAAPVPEWEPERPGWPREVGRWRDGWGPRVRPSLACPSRAPAPSRSGCGGRGGCGTGRSSSSRRVWRVSLYSAPHRGRARPSSWCSPRRCRWARSTAGRSASPAWAPGERGDVQDVDPLGDDQLEHGVAQQALAVATGIGPSPVISQSSSPST